MDRGSKLRNSYFSATTFSCSSAGPPHILYKTWPKYMEQYKQLDVTQKPSKIIPEEQNGNEHANLQLAH